MILREPIVQVLFQHGMFVAESTRLTARALLYYSMGLPAFATVKLIVPAFYSTQDTRTPVRVAGITVLVNIALNVFFLLYFFAKFKNGSPALASALAGYFNVGVLFVVFRLRFGRLGTWEILLSMGKIAVCAAMMGVVCWSALRYSQFDMIEHFFPRLLVFVSPDCVRDADVSGARVGVPMQRAERSLRHRFSPGGCGSGKDRLDRIDGRVRALLFR